MKKTISVVNSRTIVVESACAWEVSARFCIVLLRLIFQYEVCIHEDWYKSLYSSVGYHKQPTLMYRVNASETEYTIDVEDASIKRM